MEADPAIDDLTFEQALRELETIVTRLESGETPLADAISLYERGDRLRRRCGDRLDAAQARIEAIRLDAGGKPAGTMPFDAG
jgi:exodeoxyribonuclease VII small subunit